MYLYLSHTNVIVLLLRRCSEKLTNPYMHPQSMPGTYRKRIYVSLVHTESFGQTRICAHSTLRVNGNSETIIIYYWLSWSSEGTTDARIVAVASCCSLIKLLCLSARSLRRLNAGVTPTSTESRNKSLLSWSVRRQYIYAADHFPRVEIYQAPNRLSHDRFRSPLNHTTTELSFWFIGRGTNWNVPRRQPL